MAKRFIDTGIFDDSWFSELSMEAKIFWIWLITRCNHAGIIDINNKLATFQTGIKNIPMTLKEIGDRCILIESGKYFIPKFIYYQYSNGLSENVSAQKSVIHILKKYNLEHYIKSISENKKQEIKIEQKPILEKPKRIW